jgi:hypothetical protein
MKMIVKKWGHWETLKLDGLPFSRGSGSCLTGNRSTFWSSKNTRISQLHILISDQAETPKEANA